MNYEMFEQNSNNPVHETITTLLIEYHEIERME